MDENFRAVMRKYLAYTLIAIAILTLVVWGVSRFVQPILPTNIKGELVLLFAILLGVVGFFSQFKDAVELFSSFRPSAAEHKGPSPETKIVTGPVQLAYGNTTNVTINVTYVFNRPATNVDFAKEVRIREAVHPHDANVPYEAPPLVAHMVGRQAEADFLKKALLRGPIDAQSIAIVGMPGVGKTSLAAFVAHDPEVIQGFSDGMLWANFSELPDLHPVLSRWIAKLSPGANISRLTDAPLLLGFLSALLQGRRVLVVLDGFEELPDSQLMVGALRNALGRQCKLLITSRLVNIPAVHTILTLDLLPEEASLALLIYEIGRKLSNEEILVAQEIAFLSGYHPLSMRLAGAYIKTKHLGLAEYRDLLRNQARKNRVIGLDKVRELSTTYILDHAYKQLTPLEKFCIRALSPLDEDQTFDARTVSGLCSIEVGTARELLEGLVTRAFVTEKFNGEFAFSHLLVLEYSRHILSSSTPAEQAKIKRAQKRHLNAK